MQRIRRTGRVVGVSALLTGLLQPPLLAGDSFTLDITGSNTVTWPTASWINTTNLNRVGGIPGDSGESPLGSDDVLINFIATSGTQVPQMDLAGVNRQINLLSFTESATNSADGNFLSTGAPATLTLKEIHYITGGREIDFMSSLSVTDVADAQALMITNATTVDFQGAVTGSDGLSIGNKGGSITFRNYQITGAIDNNATSGAIRFGFQATGGPVTHNIPSLTARDRDQIYHFFRSAGTDAVNVNIDHINVDFDNLETLRIGGSSLADGTPDTTVNLNTTPIVYKAGATLPGTASTTPTTTRNFIVTSNYAGVVNLNVNLRQDQTLGTELLTFSGDGVLNINAQLQDLTGNARTGTVRIDGTRSLEIGVAAPTVFGNALVEVRSGTVMRYDYDVFTGGYGGMGLTNISGTSVTDNTGGVALNFNALQSGFVDPINAGQPLTVRTYNTLTGNLTNAVFTGPGQNIVLENDAVLGPITGVALPTRAELGGATVWQALTDNNQTVIDIGDDGAGIFKGVAFSPILHNGGATVTADDSLTGFTGTLSARSGQDLEVLVSSNSRLVRVVTGNDHTELNATTGVANFRGAKELALEGSGGRSWKGTVSFINRIGTDQFSPITSQNSSILRIGGTDAIASGQSVLATHGRVTVEDSAAINNGGSLTIGAGALLDLSSLSAITRGNVLVQSTGGVYWNSAQAFNLSTSASWAFEPGAMLVLDGDQNLDTPALQLGASTTQVPALASMMNWIIQDTDADLHTGAALRIGQDRILTGFASASADLQRASTNIETFAGVTNVIIAGVRRTAENGGSVRSLTLSNLLYLPDTALQIGDLAPFTTVVGSTGINTTFEDVLLTGIVSLQGGDTTSATPTTNIVKSINVVAGRLIVGSQESTLIVGNNALAVSEDLVIDSWTSSGAHQFLDGDIHVGGNIVLNPSGADPTTVPGASSSTSQLFINADFTAGVANLLQDRLITGTLAAGTDGIRVHDFGLVYVQIAEDVVGGNPTDIQQRFTIARTAASASSTASLDRALLVEAVGTTTGSSNIMNLRDVQLNADSVFTVDEGSSASVRAALTLRGNATIAETTGTGTTADDFDLLSVASDNTGTARTLYVGSTSLGNDTSFFTRLFGNVSADVTLDLVNSQLNYDTGSVGVGIDGTVIVREFGRLVTEVDTDNVTTLNIATPIVVDVPVSSRRVALSALRNATSTTGTTTLIYDGITINDGALLTIARSNTIAHANVLLAGEGHVADINGSSSFDLVNVASTAPGQARTLFFGTTGHALDQTTLGSLRGAASSDVTIDIVGGTLTVLTSVGGDIQGDVIVRAGQKLTIHGGSDTLNNATVFGDVTFASGGSLVVAGTLSGTGDVAGPLTVTGTFSPGASIGTMTTGDLTLADGSVLEIELGLVSGDVSDKIDITGALNLAGGIGLITLDLDPLVAAIDQIGTYTLMTYTGALTGDASNFLVTGDLTPGFAYDLVINDTGGNGGSVLLNVGAFSIPEPASLALLMTGMLAMGRRRRR